MRRWLSLLNSNETADDANLKASPSNFTDAHFRPNRPLEDLALAGYVGPPKSGQKDAASEF